MNFTGCLPTGQPSKPIPPAPKPTPTEPQLPPLPSPTPSKSATKPPVSPSPPPSTSTSAAPTPTPSSSAPGGNLATTGGGVDSRIVFGAVGAILIGLACLGTAMVRRRATRS